MIGHHVKLGNSFFVVIMTFLDRTLIRNAKRQWAPCYLYEFLTRNDSYSLNEFNIFPVKTIEFQYMNYRKNIYIMYINVTFVKKV